MMLDPKKAIEDAEQAVASRKPVRKGALPVYRQAEALEVIADEATMIRAYLQVLLAWVSGEVIVRPAANSNKSRCYNDKPAKSEKRRLLDFRRSLVT
jgi:hypothetical protein